jgi:hypothetical protein
MEAFIINICKEMGNGVLTWKWFHNLCNEMRKYCLYFIAEYIVIKETQVLKCLNLSLGFEKKNGFYSFWDRKDTIQFFGWN